MNKYIPPFDILDKYCQDSIFKQYYPEKEYKIKHRYNSLQSKETKCNKKNDSLCKKIHFDNSGLLIYSIGKNLYVNINKKNKIKFKEYSIDDIPIILDIIREGLYSKIRSRLKTAHTSKWIYYYNVWIETEKNAHNLENIEKRGKHYSIDHVIPITYGYSNKICPLKIGGFKNLRVICSIENIKKAQFLNESELYRIY